MLAEFKRQVLRLRTAAFDMQKDNVDINEDFKDIYSNRVIVDLSNMPKAKKAR